MTKLVMRKFDEEKDYEGDIKRIVAICAASDCEIDQATAKRAWELYSEDMAAGWIRLPYDDNAILSIVLRYTEFE